MLFINRIIMKSNSVLERLYKYKNVNEVINTECSSERDDNRLVIFVPLLLVILLGIIIL